MTDNLSIDPDLVRQDQEGDVFTHTDGHKYKVIKKTRTAMSVERYYWWNHWWDWMMGEFDGKP